MSQKTVVKKPVFDPADFVHLHLHSHYSVLDGLSHIEPLLDKIKALGMKSVALTDHGTLSGVIQFYQECLKRDLKPIIGIEAYLASRKHTDKDMNIDRRYTHLILLAQNNQGYRNLMQLSTLSYSQGMYYKPRIDKDLLKKYGDGLIVLSGCMGGEIGEALQKDDYQEAKKIALWYKKVFGSRFYLEMQDHSYAQEIQSKINQQLLKLSAELKIEPVVTSDSHYLEAEDKMAHEILLCVQTKRFFDDETRMSLKDWDLKINDPKEIVKRWQDVSLAALINTQKIAQKCQVDITFNQILLPQYTTPKSISSKDYLKQMVFCGLAWRYANLSLEKAQKLDLPTIYKKLNKTVIDRAEYELDVIDKMGFNDYFLIVWDFCKWGKSRNIIFGPGRGSAAGSIVSYSLDIVSIDPLKYSLLFERFLNAQRISMPDIDIDIEDSRRDEVIEYVVQKYGEDRVANIITFDKMAARSAVRDVARVLKMSYQQADQLAKMLPSPVQGRHIPLKSSLQNDEKIKAKYNSSKEIKQIFDIALKLEGTIRSRSVHAAGIIIAPDKLVNFTPLEMSTKGVVATQYDMKPIEDLGLLKMDFLGLSTLTILKNALRIIKKVYGQVINLDELALDDKATYQLLAQGDTVGVFQLVSKGVRQYLQRLKPDNFEDVAAMLALYRPGPLSAGIVDQFVERKRGRQKISTYHPTLEPILASTYGVLVYQEQVMEISRDICGFDGMQADELRKAMGKKQRETMNKLGKKFIDGGVKTSNIPQAIVEKLWQDIVGFADYAFNRAHSVSYALIAYQSAYLKTHFRSAFMAAVLTSEANNPKGLKTSISDCHSSHLTVLPPDINESFPEFAIVPQADNKETYEPIRFGFQAVKNTSNKAVDCLSEIRQKDGPYKDFDDFILRQKDNPHFNRKTLESLIKAGTFDCWQADREVLLNKLDNLNDAINWSVKQANSTQISLLGNGSLESFNDLKITQTTVATSLKPAPSSLQKQLRKLDYEREMLSVYVSAHPLDLYKKSLENLNLTALAEINDDLGQVSDGMRCKVGGIISDLKTATAKISRRKMAIIELEDQSGSLELVVFPAIFEKYSDCWSEGNVLALTLSAHTIDSQGNTLDNLSWTIEGAKKIQIS